MVEKQRKDKIVSKLHAILAPFLLRRVKDEIARTETKLTLPPKVRRLSGGIQAWYPCLVSAAGSTSAARRAVS